MKKMLNYETLGNALKAMSDACFKAAEQQKNGEKVTACGMSDDDLDNLCEQIPFMLNPYMTAGQVKKEAHISESTLRRAIADGELESVGNAGDHSHFFKKWDVREFIKKRLKRNKQKRREARDCFSLFYALKHTIFALNYTQYSC